MKLRFYKRVILLASALLLLGLGMSCFVWIGQEQRQIAFNRQLITALENEAGERPYAQTL